MKRINLILCALCLLVMSCNEKGTVLEPVDLVNPMIGTSNGGNTFPGASVPWGMVYAAPNNSGNGMGYRYLHGINYFYGYTHNNLSGVGCSGDFGNVLLMPTSGQIFNDPYKNRSKYTDEIAEPGYYQTKLTTHDILSEVTATKRAAIHRLSFPAGQGNLTFGITTGKTESLDAYARLVSPTEFEGYNKSGNFCDCGNRYTIYFVAKVNQPANGSGTWKKRTLYPGKKEITGDKTGVYFSYQFDQPEELQVKIGISYVSIENARENLEKEIPGWDFDKIKAEARNSWNEQLSKIKVSGADKEDQIKFYTALFHSLIHPNIINDMNGEYPAMKTGETRIVEGRDQYTVFSLWDTYRTLHPLLTLVYPDVQTDILQTMADHVKHGGELPFWELGADETYVMNGDPSPIVVTDSYFKGLNDFDVDLVFKTMKESALDTVDNKVRPMQKFFTRHGFLPFDDCGPDDVWGKPRMVSECLEYAYADWATAKMSEELGENELAAYLHDRSKAYRYYWDSDTGFLRPRYTDMSWYSPFYPSSYNGNWHNTGFVEGNSWQYTFFVPHDIDGLRELMGSDSFFVSHLQRCFDEKNFTINNEPDINYPYLFSEVPGEAWRTQKLVSEIMENEFGIEHDGLPGNDDAGTISAWYVFSAMGFYPTTAGKPEYTLGSPVFDKVVIELDKDYYPGNKIIIETENNGKDHDLVQKIELNSKSYSRYQISHQEMVDGAYLKFWMKK